MSFTTRTGLGKTLQGAVGGSEVAPEDDAFAHLVVSSKDGEGVGKLLGDTKAREAILLLTRDEAATEIRSLRALRESLRLTIRRVPLQVLSADNVEMWLANMLVVLDAAESVAASSLSSES